MDMPIQPNLFGGPSQILGLHVVAAHTRVLHDGTQVEVAEHVRWNRGKKRRRSASSSTGSSQQQPDLFAPAPTAHQLTLF